MKSSRLVEAVMQNSYSPGLARSGLLFLQPRLRFRLRRGGIAPRVENYDKVLDAIFVPLGMIEGGTFEIVEIILTAERVQVCCGRIS